MASSMSIESGSTPRARHRQTALPQGYGSDRAETRGYTRLWDWRDRPLLPAGRRASGAVGATRQRRQRQTDGEPERVLLTPRAEVDGAAQTMRAVLVEELGEADVLQVQDLP